MTGPEVLISGGGDPDAPRQLPAWLRRGVPAVVVLGLLVALGVRLAGDQRRHEVALQAADDVDAAVRINELGIGASGTVVVGIQVSGRGAEVRVDRPSLRPAEVGKVSVSGAPAVVDAGSGSQLRLRLQPDCGLARDLARVDVDLPITPESGKRHVLRVPFPDGPDMVRRACGYLPVDEALTTTTYDAHVVGEQLRLRAWLRNDGRDRLTVTGITSPGLVVTATLPVRVLPGSQPAPFQALLRGTDCAHMSFDPQGQSPVLLQVANGSGVLTEVPLSVYDDEAAAYMRWVRQVCP